tara:strand:+ start:244 stop:480 length:237 start_codon:yes stop_codon:yes gene_type:complete
MAYIFKPGDIVQLKSGGPAMTVERAFQSGSSNEINNYACSWFAGAKDSHKNFTEEALQKYVASKNDVRRSGGMDAQGA